MRYVIETWRKGEWHIFDEADNFDYILHTFHKLHSLDNFGIRLTVRPIYS